MAMRTLHVISKRRQGRTPLQDSIILVFAVEVPPHVCLALARKRDSTLDTVTHT